MDLIEKSQFLAQNEGGASNLKSIELKMAANTLKISLNENNLIVVGIKANQ
jgi:hypothetical protein